MACQGIKSSEAYFEDAYIFQLNKIGERIVAGEQDSAQRNVFNRCLTTCAFRSTTPLLKNYGLTVPWALLKHGSPINRVCPCFQNRSDQDVHSGAPEQLELLVQLLPGRGDGDAVLHSGLPAALPAHVRAEEEGSRQRLEEKGRLKVFPIFFGAQKY